MYKTALVLGLGVSGEAAARLLLGEGTCVTAVDYCDNTDLRNRSEKLEKEGAVVILGSDELPDGNFEVCIISPGVPSHSAWARTIKTRRIEILSELELGASRCECPMLAVTGSNGKSTLSKVCGEAMALAGQRVVLAGNYGLPLCAVAGRSAELDWIVLEVSSFQLERVRSFRPRVGVLLNVQPNHLDRHGDMETYMKIKARLFRRMRNAECPDSLERSGRSAETGAKKRPEIRQRRTIAPGARQGPNLPRRRRGLAPQMRGLKSEIRNGEKGDVGIVLDKDLEAVKRLSRGRNRWVTFGLSEQADYRYVDGWICRSISVKGTIFENEVMGLTAAAAVAAIGACGFDPRAVESAIESFEPLPHRMQEILRIGGVRFVDDSKATNIAALQAALKMTQGSVRLIAGGLLKEKDLKPPKELLAQKVRKAYLIGKASEEMEVAWRDVVQCSLCVHLEKAVEAAWQEAEAGETILLSPGGASFDQFRNFEDRGEQFVRIVKSLNKGGVR